MCLALLLPFLFNFSYLCSMDTFRAEQDKPFSIISSSQQIIVPYEYAVQLKALHPLSDRVPFWSQHRTEDIKLLLQSFKAAKKNKVDGFLKGIVGNVPHINVENEITNGNQQPVCDFFKRLIQLEALKQMGKIHTLMSVAYDLQAIDFAMLCVPHVIDAPSQSKLFSTFVSPKKQLKFEKLIEKYVVAKAKKTRINETEFDIQDTRRSAWIPRAHVSPCNQKIIKIVQNRIEIYNEQKELLLQLFDGNFRGEVVGVGFSKDGRCIVGVRCNSRALHEKSALCIWNAENGKLLVEFPLVHEAIFADLNDNGTLAGVILKYIGSNSSYDWNILVIDVTNHAIPKIINQISSYGVDSLYFRDDNTIVFYENVPHGRGHCRWDLNAGKKMIAELDFAQKIFLYQLYECVKFKKSSVSLMIGFVQDSVTKSLPKVLQDWVFSRAYNIRSEHQGDDFCSIM